MLNFVILWTGNGRRVAAVLWLLMLSAAPAAGRDVWTLEESVQRVMEIAPEIRGADAEVSVREGELTQAGAWPNPSIEVRADERLGIEDGGGGFDVTQFSVSQPLPLNRLTHQRKQAKAKLASAEAQRRHQQLLLEYKTAQRFHALQLAAAKLQLAKKRLQQASRYQHADRRHSTDDPLIRYLTPLERMRLDIVQQAAKQMVDVAEGEFNEATAGLKALLAILVESELDLMPLTPVPAPVAFTLMENALQAHPALEAKKHALRSAQAGVAVAKSQRFADPTITLFQEQDFLAGRRNDFAGIMLNIQIPLWNQNNGRVTQARHSVHQVQARLRIEQRELRTKLYKSYIHIGHLIEQAEHYRTKLLQPAQRVFKLTRKGFAAGALNILTLIDANNTFFDAKERYFELLQEGWLEQAELRLAAGLSLLDANKPVADIGEVN